MLRKRSLFGDVDPWKELDRLLHRTTGEWSDFPPLPATRRMLPMSPVVEEFMPAVDCFTRDKQVIVRAELPGVDPKQVEVSVVGNTLVIKGEKKDERKVEDDSVYFREITRGRFERVFELPEGVRKEQVNAVFQNGVLEVTLPAAALETARKVPIEIQDVGKRAVKAA